MAKITVDPAFAARLRAAMADPIGRNMMKRGLRVESRAKELISTSPKRVNSGRLRSSIRAIPIPYMGTFGAAIGTNVYYALWVHDGTGLYGPRHMKITPKRAKYLRFTPKGSSGAIYRRSVKGMKPNPFLRDALPAARL